MFGINLSLTPGNTVIKGGGLEPEASALFARMTVQPDAARKTVINTLIKDLKTAGIWAKLDTLQLIAAHDAQAARQNWIADRNNLTAVSSPAFTADRGYAGDGSAANLTTNYNPSTVGNIAQINTITAGVFVRIAQTDLARVYFGANDNISNYIQIVCNLSDVQYQVAVNTTGRTATGVNGQGFFVGQRLDGTRHSLFKDGVSVASTADASSALPNRNIRLLARDNNGGVTQFSTAQISAWFCGALSDTEITTLNTLVRTYLTSVGAI